MGIIVVGLGLVAFLVGKATFRGAAARAPRTGTGTVSPIAPQPAEQNQGAEAPLTSSPESAYSQGQPTVPPPAGGQEAAAESPPGAGAEGALTERASAASPREVPVQIVGEPALRVNASYQPRSSATGSVGGFLVRGAVTNLSGSNVERVVLSFTATGALVVSQAAYEALLRPQTPSGAAPLQPYWNREVVLAYQPNLLYNLGPGETRPFEFIAATNMKNPPGLRQGEIVQASQPEEVSLLVRVEGGAASAIPSSPPQRP